MATITNCHKEFYKFPYNEFLNFRDWNCLYDFIYNYQGKKEGRHNLICHIDSFKYHLLAKAKRGEIKFFDSRLKRNKYLRERKK